MYFGRNTRIKHTQQISEQNMPKPSTACRECREAVSDKERAAAFLGTCGCTWHFGCALDKSIEGTAFRPRCPHCRGAWKLPEKLARARQYYVPSDD